MLRFPAKITKNTSRPANSSFRAPQITSNEKMSIDSTPEDYWGTFLLNDEEPTSMLVRLAIALGDFAASTSTLHTPKQDVTKAKTYFLPEMFITIYKILDLEPMPFPDDISSLDTDVLDRACATLYAKFEMPHEMGSRRSESTGTATPLLLRSGIVRFITLACQADPEIAAIRLSTLLDTKSLSLYDPMTDEPFQHTTIPRLCLPIVDVPSAKATWEIGLEALRSEMPEWHEHKNRPQMGTVTTSYGSIVTSSTGGSRTVSQTVLQTTSVFSTSASNADESGDDALLRLQKAVSALPENRPHTIAEIGNLMNQQAKQQALVQDITQ
ncbi:hypothetical protein BT63DRAFT_417278 [Microthyrium microscopicum]|uniref:DUF7514 domain-containing protein n=1 Tax=Microthyrium microscopicum TaxID=703497 RepID=A0A6A6U0W5_9PEZI|nr:hypothetical protein BT63DRAFT_417278 [Microthyrium microscopicum]